MKNDIIKRVRTEVEQIVDNDTGEVIDINIKEINVITNPDEFALIYAGLWNVIIGTPLSKSDVEMFAHLVINYADGTVFSITKHTKEIVAKMSNKSSTSYNKSTANLIKYNLIVPVANKVYVINPRYAFKGSSTNRNRALIDLVKICPTC